MAFNMCISSIVSFVVVSLIGIFKFYKYKEQINSPHNWSFYDRSFYSWVRKVKANLFMSKSKFNFNRVYWNYSNLDVAFYTTNCNELQTINHLFKKCSFNLESKSIDKFVEMIFVSAFISIAEEEEEKLSRDILVNKFVEFNYKLSKENEYQITLAYKYENINFPTKNNFNFTSSSKTPDVLLTINDPNRTYNFIIDIKNKNNNKNKENVFNKYKELILDDNTFIFTIFFQPKQEKMSIESWNLTLEANPQQSPENAIKLFDKFYAFIFQKEFTTRALESVRGYNEDRNYWINCFNSKKINKSQA